MCRMRLLFYVVGNAIARLHYQLFQNDQLLQLIIMIPYLPRAEDKWARNADFSPTYRVTLPWTNVCLSFSQFEKSSTNSS